MGDRYGIPYMGSKSQIAENIIQALPRGKRFVDLFGGGFSMSHCALNRYDEVLYIEKDPLLIPLIEDSIDGKYDYSVFKPPFVSRSEYMAKRDADAYTRIVWSFADRGASYLFNEDREAFKKSIHNLVVFGIKDENIEKLKGLAERMGDSTDVAVRRRAYSRFMKDKGEPENLQLEELTRIERLQNLERLKPKMDEGKITLICGDYRDYEYREGDIVYCDPPYEGTQDYGSKFDSKEFYRWVKSKPFPVFFSSYEISDPDMWDLLHIDKVALLNDKTTKKTTEHIWCNQPIKFNSQVSMFGDELPRKNYLNDRGR